MEIRVGPPTVTIHADDQFCVCAANAEISSTDEQGYFAADTRLVSGYRLKLGRARLVLINSAAVAHHCARFEFTNPVTTGADGLRLGEHCLHLRLDRSIGTGVHEDYDLTNYSRVPVVVDLEVSIESDFADLFDVKDHRPLLRGTLHSSWDGQRLSVGYQNDQFERGLVIEPAAADSPASYANGGLLFRVELAPRQRWHTCLLWRPVLESGIGSPPENCHDLTGSSGYHQAEREWVSRATIFGTSSPVVTQTLSQAVDDLAGLRMHRHDPQAAPGGSPAADSWVPAAGVPWFVSLFGRDSLIVSLQTLALSPRFAVGSLNALGRLQADDYDDDRDMQPGKISHEIRHGELAALKLIPHTPYYGTHEATTLYVLVAAEAWRWHGDRAALDQVRPHVERALAWIDSGGDPDGDGLQEYRTRAPHGYYNQGWKDAGDAIAHPDGRLASLPIALCEIQGMVVAAKRAWADVLDQVYGEYFVAARLREQAQRLADAIETRFWWDDEGTYYLGLDGDKQPIRSVASNAGQLLWTGAVPRERALRVAGRLMAPDMWSGWGVRTLSDRHVAYNPFSYQLGSVWPHDNALMAAGFRRYGLDEEAAQIARGLFDAAERFSSRRLPELFAGLPRDDGAFPVQYLGANVPQAWASGAVIQLLTVLLGLEADAAAGELRVRPALPSWLTDVRLEQLTVGGASVDLRVSRGTDGTHIIDVTRREGQLAVVTE
ncbi:MAG TPA: glycogen debranching N-terminal domain-containing protein [Streptosporangiaceae bacterium]|nr:glycogen debranching N-terminal domain-containing protein [Streptosporangiaceae bacterium]